MSQSPGRKPGGLGITVPVLCGIIGGIVALNVALGLAWWIFRRARARKAAAGPSMSVIAKPVPKLVPTSLQSPTYLQLMMALQTDANKRGSYQTSESRSPAGSRPFMMRAVSMPPDDIYTAPRRTPSSNSRRSRRKTPTYDLTRPGESQVRRGLSVRSAESESVYSAASVPLDFHDRVMHSNALTPVPPSPILPLTLTANQSARFSTSESLRPDSWTGYSWPQVENGRRTYAIREELAPETYMNTIVRWKIPLDDNREQESLSSTVPQPVTSETNDERTNSRHRNTSSSSLSVPLLSRPAPVATSPSNSPRRFSNGSLRRKRPPTVEFEDAPQSASSFESPLPSPSTPAIRISGPQSEPIPPTQTATLLAPPHIPPRSPLRAFAPGSRSELLMD